MFRHQGKRRTFEHNLRLATILSFVAGIVNVTGFLEFHRLTTNVTGHFAFFIQDVAHVEVWKGMVYFLYIFSFLLGSFCSSFLIEKFRESTRPRELRRGPSRENPSDFTVRPRALLPRLSHRRLNVFVLPTLLESLIFLAIPLMHHILPWNYPDLIVCALLFAMGLQNSFVTKISNAVVRTTHLTGLFTDLGIELSQLLFPRTHPQQDQIKATIRLRAYIISFFFLGGLVGGFIYSSLGLRLDTLLVAAIVLISSLFFDDIRFGLIKLKRRYPNHRALSAKALRKGV